MRKPLFLILPALLLAGGTALFLRRQPPRPAPVHEEPARAAQTATPPPSTPAPVSGPEPLTPALKSVNTQQELFAAYDAINAAADADPTPTTLTTLVRYAMVENKDVRTAALDALIRVGDPASAELLQTAAKQSGNPAVMLDLLKTAEYIALPSANLNALPKGAGVPKDATTSQPRRNKRRPAESPAPAQP